MEHTSIYIEWRLFAKLTFVDLKGNGENHTQRTFAAYRNGIWHFEVPFHGPASLHNSDALVISLYLSLFGGILTMVFDC